MSNLKWIACQGLDLNPYNISVPDRLNKSGFALIFDEFGNGRVDKAQLCIHSALSENQHANILLICPESLMQIWYSILLSELGADFKFISATGDSVAFHSACTANLYIVGEEKLKSATNATGLMKDAGVVWDLMIIDAGSTVVGVDWAGYYNNCRNKAKQLLIFAPNPFPHDSDVTSVMPLLKETLKAFLYDENHKAEIANLKIDESIVKFTPDAPVTRYYIAGRLNQKTPNLVVCEYEIDEALFNSKNRFMDVHAGVPYYTLGGNVFEEFDADLKNKYMRARYDASDIKKLSKADNKLKVFLAKLDDILKNPENNVVIYFTSTDTLHYITKVINAVYPELRDAKIITRTDSVLDSRYLKLQFSAENPDYARLTLATDAMGEHYHGMGRATHIINYEYPENPAELERRFFRTARIGMCLRVPDEFIIFTDTQRKFDGRILGKVMFASVYKCFKAKIPSQNVLFWVPNAERYIVEMLEDLRKVIYNARGETREYARNFCAEYNIADRGLVSTAGKTAVYAESLLGRLVKLFDVEQRLPRPGVELDNATRELLVENVREGLDKLRSGYIYFNDINDTVPRSTGNPNYLNKIAVEYEDHEIPNGVKAAESELEGLLSMSEGSPAVTRGALESVPDGLKTAVLYNIWRYCKVNKGHKESLRAFMDKYNKGVI
ncbi:MAG: hypothetical protein FWG45_02975 [Oscillospiraceae bacterium]|nr:hypothetical protein [Oscillospiraceae bacterium]